MAAPVVDKPKRRRIGAAMSRTTNGHHGHYGQGVRGVCTGQGRCSVRAGEVPDEHANARAEVEEPGEDDRIHMFEEERGEGVNRA